MLAFWGTWCSACRAEAPRLSTYREWLPQIDLVGVCVDRRLDTVRRHRPVHRNFQSLHDPDLALADRFGVTTTPSFVVLEPGRAPRLTHEFIELRLWLGLSGPGTDLSINAPMIGEPRAMSDRPTAFVARTLFDRDVQRTATLMGTEIQFLVGSFSQKNAELAVDAAIAEMERIEALMTDWQESSQLSAINRQAGVAPVKVDRELLELIAAAKDLSETTDGKFDVTYASAGKLWDFQAQPPLLPDETQIRAAVAKIDSARIEIDRAAGTVYLPESDMRIGLGGIAKGYAVDRAVETMEQAGLRDFAVNAGGDLTVRGRRGDAKLWWVGVREPRTDKLLAVVPTSNVSVATSGDYERFFEFEGKRYSHILDPTTGYPAGACQSVTIVAPKAFLADALATGVFVLGPEAGMKLVEKLSNVEGVIVAADGSFEVSSGLRDHPKPNLPPQRLDAQRN